MCADNKNERERHSVHAMHVIVRAFNVKMFFILVSFSSPEVKFHLNDENVKKEEKRGKRKYASLVRLACFVRRYFSYLKTFHLSRLYCTFSFLKRPHVVVKNLA